MCILEMIVETRKTSEFFRATSALDSVTDGDVQAMAEGFLQAAAFADCSADDEDGLEDAEWAEGAFVLAKDTVRNWLDRISLADYKAATERLTPHADMGNDVRRAIGGDIYYEAADHGVGFMDRPELEEGGLAERMSKAQRERIEPPFLGDDGHRHFSDEYRLFRIQTTASGSLVEQVRRSLNRDGIMLSATGPDSLKASFVDALENGARLADVHSPEYQAIARLAASSNAPIDDVAAALTISVAMAAKDVPMPAQENVLLVAKGLEMLHVISPETVELIRSPPEGIVSLLKPDVQATVRGRTLKLQDVEKAEPETPALKNAPDASLSR